MTETSLHGEVRRFFDRYAGAFESIDGKCIAALYHMPTVTMRGDGSVLKQWRQSYNVVRMGAEWQILVSTFHVA